MEELERQKILEQKKKEEGIEEKKDIDITPFWEKNKDLDLGRKKKKDIKKNVKKTDDVLDVNFSNPYAFNEGDVDLDQYFRPLIVNAGE